MENKQTAVEWLEEQLFIKYQFIDDEGIFEQAKQMEKEQIFDAYETSHISMMTTKQYYNETYGKE